MSKPAILPSWRRATRLLHGQRSITMLRPICASCQSGDNVPPDWFRACPHDPYVTMAERHTPVPEYEDEMAPDGKGEMKPTGRKFVKEMKDAVSWEPVPNTVEIALTLRVNSGEGVVRARRKGFILPSEVRSPSYPNGIADACQFRDCKWQKGLKKYASGTFCRELEARLVSVDDAGTTLEVGWGSPESGQERERILQAAHI